MMTHVSSASVPSFTIAGPPVPGKGKEDQKVGYMVIIEEIIVNFQNPVWRKMSHRNVQYPAARSFPPFEIRVAFERRVQNVCCLKSFPLKVKHMHSHEKSEHEVTEIRHRRVEMLEK
jgi:hypothetical protein